MITAVLDTNVLVSALCLPKSLPAHLLHLGLSQRFDLVLSDAIILEFNDVMHRRKIQDRYSIKEEVIEMFTNAFTQVIVAIAPEDIPDAIPGDPKDNHVVGCAAKSHADYIVSGDRHLLVLGHFGDIRIVTPAQFLIELQAAGADES